MEERLGLPAEVGSGPAPQKAPMISSLETCECVPLQGTRHFADGIKDLDGDQDGSRRWPPHHHKGPSKRESEGPEPQGREDMTPLALQTLEGATSGGTWWGGVAVEAGKAKNENFPRTHRRNIAMPPP